MALLPEMCVRGRSRRVRIQADDMDGYEVRRKLIALAGIALILRVNEEKKMMGERMMTHHRRGNIDGGCGRGS